MTWTRDLDADERDAAELTAGLIDRQRVDLTTVCRAAKALPEYIAHVRELETEVKRLHGLLLGGESTLEEIDLAAVLAQARGDTSTDTLAALKAARALREMQSAIRDLEADRKRAERTDRRHWLTAGEVDAIDRPVDIFGGPSKRRRERVEYQPVAPDPLTEKQFKYLLSLGVPGDKALTYGRRQASVVIEKMKTQGGGV